MLIGGYAARGNPYRGALILDMTSSMHLLLARRERYALNLAITGV